MRCFTCFLVAFCLSATVLYAIDSPKLSPAEQEVVDVRVAWVKAYDNRDFATWSRYVADDCIFSDDNGAVYTKAHVMEQGKRFPREYDYGLDPRDFVVHLYGTTAVLNYRVTAHEQFTDTEVVTEHRDTETYIKQNGTWLLIARALVNVPVNLRKPVAVDTAVYKDYVGQYAWRPLDDVETVSVKDGRLWTQSGTERDEYFPLGRDSFFMKSELGIVTFLRDPQNHVTGYLYHLADGQEIRVKKIK